MSKCVICGKVSEYHFDLCLECLSVEAANDRMIKMLEKNIEYVYGKLDNE